MSDFALSHKLLQGSSRLLGWRGGIRPVHLIQVDVVRRQVTQARLNTGPQPPGAVVTHQVRAIHPEAALGGDDHLVAPHPLPQALAEQTLRATEAVALGRVEQGDPLLHGARDGALGLGFVKGPPITSEGPGAQSQHGDVKVCLSESRVSHGSPFELPSLRVALRAPRVIAATTTFWGGASRSRATPATCKCSLQSCRPTWPRGTGGPPTPVDVPTRSPEGRAS